MSANPNIQAAFWDAVTCSLQEIEAGVKRLAPGREHGRLEAIPSTPNRRRVGSSGQLAGPNPRRSGFYLHNATDGTLLIRFGEESAELRRYTLAIGPGDWYASDRISSELVKGAVQYAWVTSNDDLSDFPADTFAAATAGHLMYTEESIREV